MFLKVAGRRCLIAGAGGVAEAKIAALLDAEAAIRVVAPEATPQVQSWAAAGQLEWLARRCEPSDLDGMFLVIAATSDPELQQNISAEARARGVLCNVVDVPGLCDFYYPAVAQRGALQIAVSTSGQSPALAQRLRKELEEQFGPEYEAWLEQLGEERAKLFAANMDPEERKRLLHDLASADAFKSFQRKLKRAKK
ncbi:MAG TPA: bifunctional precorrin-2 dehydrogenase/sirohydrochlorin ferrochelatase [Candidatus Dormibacteraeota bacterium]|nr:bifunctional precorrin-2 dehydrogenase/sirohydrochlorin ferrochelatase [Candidatus Dormibacteraeota bacterium]